MSLSFPLSCSLALSPPLSLSPSSSDSPTLSSSTSPSPSSSTSPSIPPLRFLRIKLLHLASVVLGPSRSLHSRRHDFLTLVRRSAPHPAHSVRALHFCRNGKSDNCNGSFVPEKRRMGAGRRQRTESKERKRMSNNMRPAENSAEETFLSNEDFLLTLFGR